VNRDPLDYAGRTAIALERLADTFDDFLALALAAVDATQAIRAADAELAEMVRPLTDVIDAIRERRIHA
jgi:hypothetical protein